MHAPHLSITGRTWELAPQPTSEQLAALPSIARDLHPIATSCLLSRIGDADITDWLQPSMQHLHDPSLMMGMGRAVDRIRAALEARQRIRIVTDYDVDGTTSSLILQQTLLRLGGQGLLDYHIPSRFSEGYGFSTEAAAKAVEDGVQLIITADIGVKDHAAVNVAAASGVDVIICDHHLPDGASVPERAYVVLCPPQQGCPYPNKSLAACGVSLKLAQSLLRDHPRADVLLQSMMKVAAIGTVADVVDLSGLENRAIVSIGVGQLRSGRHAPGLQALLEVSGLSPAAIDAGALGFKIGPRINAAGRLKAASSVVELFSERDPRRAYARAQELDRLNEKRRHIQDHLVEACLAQLGDAKPSFAVLWGPEDQGWHRGVVGIVAARLRDKINRPVAIVSVNGDEARGSVRSTPAVHAVNALGSARDILGRFGGHPAAAGFSLPRAQLPALRERLDAFASAQLQGEHPVPSLRLDADCRAQDLDWGVIRSLQRLEPHGKGNPAPLLLVYGVRPTNIRMLSGGRHIKFRAGSIDALWWNSGAYASHLSSPVDLAVRTGVNHWNGRSTLQLTVEDIRPHRR